MDVPGHIVYGRDLGKTFILCRVRYANSADRGSALRSWEQLIFSSVVTSTLNSSWNLATKIFRDSMALIGMDSWAGMSRRWRGCDHI